MHSNGLHPSTGLFSLDQLLLTKRQRHEQCRYSFEFHTYLGHNCGDLQRPIHIVRSEVALPVHPQGGPVGVEGTLGDCGGRRSALSGDWRAEVGSAAWRGKRYEPIQQDVVLHSRSYYPRLDVSRIWNPQRSVQRSCQLDVGVVGPQCKGMGRKQDDLCQGLR